MPHIIYKKLQLRNVYSYRECCFDLENQGLVFVRGLNVDDGGFLGAGKSSLFEAFSVLQMGKGGKNTNLSDMVNHAAGKDMEVSLLLSIDGKDYKLVLYQKHSKFGNGTSAIDLDMGRNVVPTNNAKHAPKWIRENLLRTKDTTFFHLTYLAQRMTNVLLTGTDAQRKHQITEMFDLNIYDKLSSHIDMQIKLAETDLRRLDNLEEELRQIQGVIKNNLSLEKLRKRYRIRKKKLKENSVALEATIQELRDKEENLREAKQRVHHIQLVKEIWGETSLLHKDMDKPTGCTKKYIIRQRKRLATVQEEYASYRENVKQLDRRNIIEKQLKKLEGTVDINVDEANQKLTSVKTKISNLQNVELPAAEIRQELLQKMQGLDLPDMELEEAKEKLENLKENRTLVLTSVKALSSQLEGDICPTCKRPFDRSVEEINKIQKSLSQKRQELKNLQQNIHHYNKYVTDLQEYNDCQIRLQEITTKRRTRAIQTDINKLTQKERDLTIILDGAQRKEILENQLKVMASGSAKELRKKQSSAKVRKERAEIKLEGAKRINAELLQIKNLSKWSKKKLERKIKRLEISIQEITGELSELSEKVAMAQNALQQVTEATTREAKLNKDLKKVRGLVNKNECYKALKIAFGQKGLKHDRLHSIMKEAAERTVPLYTDILWPNRTISLDLEPAENAIRFQLSRSGTATSSRALSGGESHKAGLAFLFGLRDLKEIYTDYSSNIIILDEPFSHLDPQGKLALLQILQMLKDKFSSIFVVSHLTEMVHNEAWDQVWWAIRENNESRLYHQTAPPSKYLQLSRRYEDELNT